MNFKITKRKVNSIDLSFENHLGYNVVNLTEWLNGEGVDLFISDHKGNEKSIQLTFDELDAICKGKKLLEQDMVTK